MRCSSWYSSSENAVELTTATSATASCGKGCLAALLWLSSCSSFAGELTTVTHAWWSSMHSYFDEQHHLKADSSRKELVDLSSQVGEETHELQTATCATVSEEGATLGSEEASSPGCC